LLQHCPRSAIVPNMYGNSPLNALAWKSSAFLSGNQLVFWKNWIYACMYHSVSYLLISFQFLIYAFLYVPPFYSRKMSRLQYL
jgi:hypothetical protein